LITLSSPPVE